MSIKFQDHPFGVGRAEGSAETGQFVITPYDKLKKCRKLKDEVGRDHYL